MAVTVEYLALPWPLSIMGQSRGSNMLIIPIPLGRTTGNSYKFWLYIAQQRWLRQTTFATPRSCLPHVHLQARKTTVRATVFIGAGWKLMKLSSWYVVECLSNNTMANHRRLIATIQTHKPFSVRHRAKFGVELISATMWVNGTRAGEFEG